MIILFYLLVIDDSMSGETAVVSYAMQKFDRLDVIVSVFTMQFIWVSRQFAGRLGYTQDEMVDKSLRSVFDVHPALIAGLINHLFWDVDGKDSQSLKTKDGSLVSGTADVKTFSFASEPYLAFVNVVFKEGSVDNGR